MILTKTTTLLIAIISIIMLFSFNFTNSSSRSVKTSPVLSSVTCADDDYLTILQCGYSTDTTGCSSSHYIQVTCCKSPLLVMMDYELHYH